MSHTAPRWTAAHVGQEPGGRPGWVPGRFAVGLVFTAVALAACSGGGASSAGVQPAAGQAAVQPADPAAKDVAAAGPMAGPGAPNAAAAAPEAARAGAGADTVAEPKIVRTAAIALTVETIGPATAKIRAAVAGFGGHLVTEAVNTTDAVPQNPTGPGTANSVTLPRLGNYGQLTFAVPADKLDAAIEAVGQHGTVVQRTASSQDVTATYVDTEARIATMTASIARIRGLMTQTQNITQIVELEAQLADREARLESMQAQLRSLKDRVAMSQLTVVVSTNAGAAVLPVEQAGFLTGLKQGWSAFVKSVTSLLTVLGALLPWLLVLALLGWPVLRWRRRRSSASVAPPAREPATVGAGPTSGTTGQAERD